MNKIILIGIIAATFVAGIGTAYAGPIMPMITLAGDVTITGDMICTDCIDAADIAPNAVGSSEIAGFAVGSAQLAFDAVDEEHIEVGAVSSVAILDNSVTSTDIADGTIQAVDIAAAVITKPYVPFKATLPSAATCDVAGGGADVDQVFIDGDGTGTFIVTSIAFLPNGVNAASDLITFRGIVIDGKANNMRTVDLTGTFSSGNADFEVLGSSLILVAGTFHNQIAAQSVGIKDIILDFFCDAGTTGASITFAAGDIIISGWAQAGETITLTYDEF